MQGCTNIVYSFAKDAVYASHEAGIVLVVQRTVEADKESNI